MKRLTGLIVLLAVASASYADSAPDKAGVKTRPTTSRSHPASTAAANSAVTPKMTLPVADADVETLTVTGTRHRSLDVRSEPGLALTSPVSRTLSDPVAVDLVDQPVQVTLQTGNTEALRERSVVFPFQSIPDRSGRDTEFLRFKLTNFKLD